MEDNASYGVKRSITLTRRNQTILQAYLFLAPYLVLLLLIFIFPAIYAFGLSFATWTGKADFSHLTLSNYLTFFTEFRIPQSFANVLVYSAIVVPVTGILAVLLGLLLQVRSGRFSNFSRTLFFVSGAIAGPALVILTTFMLNPSISPFGPILHLFGFQSSRELIANQDNWNALLTIMYVFSAAGAWIGILYGALNNLSTEVIEAAVIDGARFWDIARYVKIPLVKSTIVYMIIMVFSNRIQVVAEPQLLAAAGAIFTPRPFSPLHIGYQYAFTYQQMGVSAAISIVMMLIGLGFAYIAITKTGVFRVE